jgi:hypothetical protein
MSPVTVPSHARVSGGNILSMLAAMGPFRKRGEQILSEVGIDEVAPEAWYPLQAYVRALETIGERMGPNTLYQVGRQIPNHVPLPPGLDSFDRVLGCFGPAFDMNHSGMPAGLITFQQETERSGRIVSRTPYPCDFDRGVIQGFFQRLLSTRAMVDPEPGAPCKRHGGDSCTHHVSVLHV